MRAVLDACVLYPTILREILLGFAEHGLYEPVFSERILGEWTSSARKLGAEGHATALIDAQLLRGRFVRAIVASQENVEARLVLPDPDDVHVVATAIAAHADCIVTFNAQDFPRPILFDLGLQRRDPDGFLWELASGAPQIAQTVVQEVLRRAEEMAREPLGIRRLLKKSQLPRFAKFLTADRTQ